MKTENRRSMVEILGVLSIMGVLSTVSVWGYSQAINNHKANLILNELNQQIHLCSAQLVMQNKDVCDLTDFKNNNDWPMSVKKIDADFFKIIISQVPKKVCRQILNKGMASASSISPTDCDKTNQIEFLFHKTLNPQMHPKKCASNTDCDICGTCSSDGYCQNECLIPLPDEQNNCGENECIVYNEESQSCQNACEQVAYLQATGTQYIDTGYPYQLSSDIVDLIFSYTESKEYQTIFGQNETIDGTTYFFGLRELQTTGTFGPLSLGIQANKYPIEWGKKYHLHIEKGSKKTYLDDITGWPDSLPDFSRNNAYLYATNNNGYTAYHSKAKVYSLKWNRNNTLIRDFIPVIAPDGEACMFDKVSKKLFCNAGSGTFKTNKD